MNDFGVKHFTKDDANHLLDYLKKHKTISTDPEGRNHLGLTIYWNYSEEYVDISMPEYVKKAMDRLQHPKPKRPQYEPHCWKLPEYGKRIQMEPDPDDMDLPDKNSTKIIQSIVGTGIYYE